MNQEDFDNLLAWLDEDRDRAADKYRGVHEGLIQMFSLRGYHDAEDLADEVINRVSRKGKQFFDEYSGEREPYFFGVARYVAQERWRRPGDQPLTPNLKVDETEPEEKIDQGKLLRDCLKHCLSRLDPDEKQQILSYYQESKQAKIDYRKVMAARLNIGPNALRVRLYRIRAKIKKCVQKCLDQRRDAETNQDLGHE